MLKPSNWEKELHAWIAQKGYATILIHVNELNGDIKIKRKWGNM
jgi:hypothetical protein